MKVLVLHWHGVCPHCKKPSCIYAEFTREECGCKLPHGFRCGSCDAWINDEEFETIKMFESPCPKEVILMKVLGKPEGGAQK